MRSIFLGTRFEAFISLSNLSDVKLVITKKKSFVDKYINKQRFRVIYFNRKNKNQIFRIIKNCKYKLIFSSGFPFKIPKSILNKNKIFINSHPSLLPKYKGLNAIRDAIEKKEKTIGCTVHYINERLDDGNIIYKKKLRLDDIKNLDTIYKKIFKIIEPQTITFALKKII